MSPCPAPRSALGAPISAPVSPISVVAAARALLGVRYRHQGRTRLGLDCAGLVILVAHEMSLSAFDTVEYGRLPDSGRMQALLDEHCTRGTMQAGMVALLRFEAEPRHLGIVADYPHGGWSLIHALATERRVCEHRIDDAWRARIVALYALPGVAY